MLCRHYCDLCRITAPLTIVRVEIEAPSLLFADHRLSSPPVRLGLDFQPHGDEREASRYLNRHDHVCVVRGRELRMKLSAVQHAGRAALG